MRILLAIALLAVLVTFMPGAPAPDDRHSLRLSLEMSDGLMAVAASAGGFALSLRVGE